MKRLGYIVPAALILLAAALLAVGTHQRIGSAPGIASDFDSPAGAGAGFFGTPLDPARQAPDFTLTDSKGSLYRLSDQRGDAVVLFFGYTSCPDVCPTTLAHFRQVKKELGEEAEGVQFVFVSVDPERDTPERLAAYVSAFDPEFVGLTGSRPELEAVWREYGIYVERVETPGSAAGYFVNHTSASFVIDPQGNLRLLHLYGAPADEVAADLKRLMAESKAEDDSSGRRRASAGRLEVSGAWVRAATAGGNSAAYMSLANPGASPITIVGASTNVAEAVELHETSIEHAGGEHPTGQVMRMHHIEAIVVPARGEVTLAPGGLHVMLFGLKQALVEGDEISLILHLEDGEERALSLPVRSVDGAAASEHAGHGS